MPAPIADSVSVPAGTTLVRGGFAGIDTTPPTWGGATLQLSNLTSTSYTVTASAGATDDTAVAGYEFYAHYKSAMTIGGDYYDFVELSDNRIAILLGDVAGKGVPAALLMAKLSAETRFHISFRPTRRLPSAISTSS